MLPISRGWTAFVWTDLSCARFRSSTCFRSSSTREPQLRALALRCGGLTLLWSCLPSVPEGRVLGMLPISRGWTASELGHTIMCWFVLFGGGSNRHAGFSGLVSFMKQLGDASNPSPEHKRGQNREISGIAGSFKMPLHSRGCHPAGS